MTCDRRRVLHVATYAAVAGLLLLFARQVDWHAASVAARDADPRLLALAALLNLLSLSLKGVRWWVFLRPLGVRSLVLVLRATFSGASLNNLLIAQGGEGARVLMIARRTGVSSARVLAALALERGLDALSYLILLVGGAWLLPLPPAIATWRVEASALLGVVVLLLVVLSIRRAPSARDAVERGTAAGRVGGYLQRFGTGIGEVASIRRVTVGALLSITAWMLQVATYHVVALAAHSSLPLAGSVAALLAVGISFLIRATPANVGIFQMVYAVTAHSFGVGEGAAVAIAVLIQLVQVVPTLLLGTLVTPRLAVVRS